MISVSDKPVLRTTSSSPPTAISSNPRWEMGSATRTLRYLHEASQNIRPHGRCQNRSRGSAGGLPGRLLGIVPSSYPSPRPLSLPQKLLPHLDVRPWCRSVKWSYRIATLAGIQVRIHLTFLLLLGFYAWVYYTEGGLPAAASGVTFTLLIFLCVLLHEFGHAFAAKAFGIRTPDITLLPIGGVARLERMPANPWQELVIAHRGSGRQCLHRSRGVPSHWRRAARCTNSPS